MFASAKVMNWFHNGKCRTYKTRLIDVIGHGGVGIDIVQELVGDVDGVAARAQHQADIVDAVDHLHVELHLARCLFDQRTEVRDHGFRQLRAVNR